MVDIDERNSTNSYEDPYEWIDKKFLPRQKKNLNRDFSDAVLLAKILKTYYPRYVDLHNYIPTSNYKIKKENWHTLNWKVLFKIDIKLSKNTINKLANSQQGAIENLLQQLRMKLTKNKSIDNQKSEDNNEPRIGDGISYESDNKEEQQQIEELNTMESFENLSSVTTESCVTQILIVEKKRDIFDVILEPIVILMGLWGIILNFFQYPFDGSNHSDSLPSNNLPIATSTPNETTSDEGSLEEKCSTTLKPDVKPECIILTEYISKLNHRMQKMETLSRDMNLCVSNIQKIIQDKFVDSCSSTKEVVCKKTVAKPQLGQYDSVQP